MYTSKRRNGNNLQKWSSGSDIETYLDVFVIITRTKKLVFVKHIKQKNAITKPIFSLRFYNQVIVFK